MTAHLGVDLSEEVGAGEQGLNGLSGDIGSLQVTSSAQVHRLGVISRIREDASVKALLELNGLSNVLDRSLDGE